MQSAIVASTMNSSAAGSRDPSKAGRWPPATSFARDVTGGWQQHGGGKGKSNTGGCGHDTLQTIWRGCENPALAQVARAEV